MHEDKPAFVRQKTYSTALFVLNSTLVDRKYPDILFGGLFKKEDFSTSEKAAVIDLTYGVLRHMTRLDHIIEHASSAVVSGLDLNILNILRICTFQSVFTPASPAGIINNAVALSAREDKFSGFVKKTVEAIIRNKDAVVFPDKEKAPVEYISLYHSHPVWIVEKWLKELGNINDVEALCSANNTAPPLLIRTNPLKTSRTSLQNALNAEDYPTSPAVFSPFGLVVDKKEGIFRTEAFRKGLFEVQDEGSQLITLLTGAQEGEIVIDTCAGNGGKTLFISGLMKNKGTVIAFETNTAKLGNLRRRAGRANATNIKTVDIDGLQEYSGRADCVFIDAPCSGMGVFRRNPDAKWRLAAKDISELAAKQKEIIRKYSGLMKPGGRLVYATCTISREENEEVVGAFLEENKDFSVISPTKTNPDLFGRFTAEDGFFRSLPHVHDMDGFFGAVMRREL
ncbi:MAG: 16S rRNA (cytosine(967)-C(5))-methyltransferase RsmB [Candidatus Methanoperedens sp.]|nr:16S rRNA (cytosine(967)-C(5))-methyltransferase RsmB [Candidatus Methanoperedens sp.]